jgi:hypothetical protein
MFWFEWMFLPFLLDMSDAGAQVKSASSLQVEGDMNGSAINGGSIKGSAIKGASAPQHSRMTKVEDRGAGVDTFPKELCRDEQSICP